MKGERLRRKTNHDTIDNCQVHDDDDDVNEMKKMMMINVRSEVGGGWKDDLDVSNPFHQPIAAFRPSEI